MVQIRVSCAPFQFAKRVALQWIEPAECTNTPDRTTAAVGWNRNLPFALSGFNTARPAFRDRAACLAGIQSPP